MTWASPVLAVAVGSAFVYSLGYQGVLLVAIPAMAKLDLNAGDAGVGLLYGAGGVGALLGTLAIGAASRVPRQGLVAGLALLGTGVGFALVGTATTLGAAALLVGLAAGVRAVCAVSYLTIVQTYAPPAARGRVMGLFMLAVLGFSPLSVGLGGALADAFGARGAFVAAGTAMACAGAYALSRRGFRSAS